MKRSICWFVSAILATAILNPTGFSQARDSSLFRGIVVDPVGGVVPNASILIRENSTGAQFSAVTNADGIFSLSNATPGTYTARITCPAFRQAVIPAIRLAAGEPLFIRVDLEVGGGSETVEVKANADQTQSQAGHVSTNLDMDQIGGIPMFGLNAMESLSMLPGVNTTGSNRNSTFVGLPQNTLNITIDGINARDNYLNTSDAFYSRVHPRMDSVEAVVVSTLPGVESAGLGAVQIRFVTRSGTNQYRGSLYEYFRNTALNANNWFNNRDLLPPPGVDWRTWKAPRHRMLLNRFGGRVGGPVRLPKRVFGRLGLDGRDRFFFFVNYEESRQPDASAYQRTILNPLAEQGWYQYTSGGTVKQVNLLSLASSKGQIASVDPTIGRLLADIRASTTRGSLKASTDPLDQLFSFPNKGMLHYQFATARLDLNLLNRHRFEFSYNLTKYLDKSSLAPLYPGFPNQGSEVSNHYALSAAARSIFSATLANEARFGVSGGPMALYPGMSAADFSGPLADQGGFALGLSVAGITNAYASRSPTRRNVPTFVIHDVLTRVRGAHSFNVGGLWTQINSFYQSRTLVPAITFGVNASYDPAAILFDAANGTKNFPGASSAQITSAQNLYAVLTGRVTQISGSAYLDESNGQYRYNGNLNKRGHVREMGFFLSDSWRARSGLSVYYGIAWQLQYPFVPGNSVYSAATVADLWGISGIGNLFRPGVLSGQEPEFLQYEKGTRAYALNYGDFAPSFSLAWSPNPKAGFMRRILGGTGKTVFRGGYSLAYTRMGTSTYTGVYDGNPGLSVNATRNVTNNNLVSGVGSDQWPLLFRQAERLGPPSFRTVPAYPLKGAVSDSVNVFDPNLRMPYSQLWSLGVQRALSNSTNLEIRYVGTRYLHGWTTFNLNELNLVESGLLNEFRLAMTNLQANIAAGRGNNFKYYGPGTGTAPLPITLAYFSGILPSQAGDATKYTSANFTSTTFVNPLAKMNPNPGSYATSLYNDANRRANAAKAGLPANLLLVNPSLQGGANLTGNGDFSQYDSMVVELRRASSRGLVVQANYVWAKGFNGTRLSFRRAWERTLSDILPHTLKIYWIYELPFGKGRALLARQNRWIERVAGGWNFRGFARIQSGNQVSFGNIRLVGMTLQDLRDSYRLHFDDGARQIYVLPNDVIQNTIRAFSTSATSATGYSASLGAPSGRYIAPANSGGCIQVVAGDCAPRTTFVRGALYSQFDLSLVRRFKFSERMSFELRGEFLNALNKPNFSWVACAGSSQTCGQVTSTRSIPRTVQIVTRINF